MNSIVMFVRDTVIYFFFNFRRKIFHWKAQVLRTYLSIQISISLQWLIPAFFLSRISHNRHIPIILCVDLKCITYSITHFQAIAKCVQKLGMLDVFNVRTWSPFLLDRMDGTEKLSGYTGKWSKHVVKTGLEEAILRSGLDSTLST
jgi:hypothetical protein